MYVESRVWERREQSTECRKKRRVQGAESGLNLVLCEHSYVRVSMILEFCELVHLLSALLNLVC